MKPPAASGVSNAMSTPTCGRFPVFFALGLLLALGGCASGEPAPERRDATGPKRPPPTPIAGHEDFFDGRIGADLRVGTLDLGAAKEAAGLDNKNGGAGGGRRHGGGGISMNGIGGGGGGGMGGGGGGRYRREAGGESSGVERPEGVRQILGGMGPAEMIHLQFTNHGTGRVELNIVDFVSPLGNFAVQPGKLILEPGQTLEVEPMTSRLGGSVTEVEATLVLHVPGRTEKKTIVLRAVPGGTPEPAPPATPGK